MAKLNNKKFNRQIALEEEQTLLSRERTMQQYMTTGLAFIGAGLIVIKFFTGDIYTFIGALLIVIGFWQLWQSYRRFERYRKIVRKIRKKEKKLGLEIGE